MTIDEALPVSRRKEVVRQGVSVGVATGLYGVSFGALSVASGLSVLQTQALSLLMFTGGSQFALVGIIGAGGSGTSAIATASLLGIRNGLYALQVSQFLKAHGPKRMLAAHITIDESTAVGIGQEEPAAQRIGFWVTGLAVLAGWNLMTFVGALAAMHSAIRRPGALMPRRRAPSARCSGPGSRRATAGPPPSWPPSSPC